MYDKNPFTLMYGIPSLSVISRDEEINKIIKSFTYNENDFMYLITGIRGTGKTVLLRKVYEIISEKKDWITIDLNPQGKIITSLANRLFDKSASSKFFKGWKISINLPYLTLTKGNEQITDQELIAEKIIEQLSNNGKKILVTIDEVNRTDDFIEFANFYQSMLGKGYKIYLLMTGLKENVEAIINDRAATFLSRAPKIELEPLSLPNIALEYKEIFGIDTNLSIEMAKLTNGYAFAYQVLGYIFYEKNYKSINDSVIKEYDSYLWKNGYTKFWNELTRKERDFVVSMSLTENNSKEEILKQKLLSESNYSQYRKRLLEKGIIKINGYNNLSFVLPRFKEFVLYAKEFE